MPLFNSVTMLTVPPASRTRSLMLTSPRPLTPPAGLDDIEAPAVVGDRELGVIVVPPQPDLGVAGAGVRDDIAQRFLCDPIQAERRVRRRSPRSPLGGERHRDGMLGVRISAQCAAQGGDQAGVLEHAGMQVV